MTTAKRNTDNAKHATDDEVLAEAEAWLNDLDPDETPADDPVDLRKIGLAQLAVEAARIELEVAVRSARDKKRTWAAIGRTLGITRQSAQQRFGSPLDTATINAPEDDDAMFAALQGIARVLEDDEPEAQPADEHPANVASHLRAFAAKSGKFAGKSAKIAQRVQKGDVLVFWTDAKGSVRAGASRTPLPDSDISRILKTVVVKSKGPRRPQPKLRADQ